MNVGKVICVLDEMIRVEFTDYNQNKKSTDWIECNMGSLCLAELYEKVFYEIYIGFK